MSQSIGIRLPDALKDELDSYAAKVGVTRNTVIQIAVEEISRGNYRIDGDHLVPTEEYLNALRPKGDIAMSDDASEATDNVDLFEYKDFGYWSLTRLLRKKDYPDEYIKKMVENMMSTAYDMPKYNPRRARQDDGGC